MVYVNQIGGISNCLFQMAALYGHAKRHGFDYAIPLVNDNPHYVGQKPYVFPGLKYCDKLPDLPSYTEPHFHYAGIPELDNVILRGYYQSELYFADCKEEFIDALGLRWSHSKGMVSIHIRRSDYLKLQNCHPVVSIEYISAAINHYREKGYFNFLVFSDDIDWAYENVNKKVFEGCEFDYSEGRTELQDLELGSRCEHQIGSNSSFSLWMHILNKNPDKTCVLPSRWFGPALPHDTKSLYPTTATLL